MRFVPFLAMAAALHLAAVGGSWGGNARAESPETGTAEWPRLLRERLNHEGISGTLVLGGGDGLQAATQVAFAAAVPAEATVVIIPPATNASAASAENVEQLLRAAGVKAVTIAERLLPAETADAEIAEQKANWIERLRAAGGVWICGDQRSQLAGSDWGRTVTAELQAVLQRGGAVGGSAVAAAVLAGVSITPVSGTESEVKLMPDTESLATAAGLDWIPGAIIAPHFESSHSQWLRSAVAEHPGRFGLGIDAATAVIVQGRSLEVIGEGAAMIVLAPASRHAAVEQPVPAGSLVDLTQLQRAARWRAADLDPGQPRFGPPSVPQGSLVIVGGGGMSPEIVDRFLTLAGGEAARIVVLPTAVPRREAFRARVPGFLARAKVASVTVLPQSRTEEIADEAFESALRAATGIWFDGGRQWNFVDAYENTRAIELFHDVLRRGGVIGGSSAGATIQGEYLVRGHPLGNTVMMAEGYERGFAFLPGVAIDQHFSQRRRQHDLISVIVRYPRLLGIGIDEATALIVQGSQAEVIGEHAVHFLRLPSPTETLADDSADAHSESGDDDRQPPQPNRGTYRSFAAGQVIDLQTLEPVPTQLQVPQPEEPQPDAARSAEP